MREIIWKITAASSELRVSALGCELSQVRPGRAALLLARTKRGGARNLMGVEVAGLSGDHVKGAGVRQREGARRDGCGESRCNLVAAGLRATDADIRHLLARLDQPVGVRGTCCAEPGPM